MVSIETPLSLMIETNEWRSSQGVQSSPMPAFLVISRNARRTLTSSSAVPTEIVVLPQLSRDQPFGRLTLAILT